jgi:hypothetical protein
MIERPAERAGLVFERGLVRCILEDTGDDPGALALMAFALQQLYDGQRDGVLAYAAYDEFGGVQGAIGSRPRQPLMRWMKRPRLRCLPCSVSWLK